MKFFKLDVITRRMDHVKSRRREGRVQVASGNAML